MAAPRTTPQIFPIPPKTTHAKIRIETLSVNISGAIKRVFDAYKTPAAPPTAAPNENDHNLYFNVCTPISSATSSSWRIASHALPARRTESRRIIQIVRRIMIRTTQKYAFWSFNENSIGPIEGGVGTLAIPFGPPISRVFNAEIRTISPKPKVTIAR